MNLEYLYPVIVFAEYFAIIFIPYSIIYVGYNRVKHIKKERMFIFHRNFWKFYFITCAAILIIEWIIVFILNGFKL